MRGQTAREVRETQLDRALALEPDLALAVAGVNDLLRPRLDRTALRDSLHTIYRSLREHGAQVLTFTMPDMTRVAPLAIALRPRIAFLNSVIREAGAAYGVTVVDLAAEPVAGHPAMWHDDRLHANSEGHRRIAAALAEAVGLPVDGLAQHARRTGTGRPGADRRRGARLGRRSPGAVAVGPGAQARVRHR